MKPENYSPCSQQPFTESTYTISKCDHRTKMCFLLMWKVKRALRATLHTWTLNCKSVVMASA